MAVKFQPTQKRGIELAEEVLAIIEAEEQWYADLAEKRGLDSPPSEENLYEVVDEGNVWNQGSWAEVYLDKLPSGTTIEALPYDVKDADSWEWRKDYSATINSGVTCGTAMCFAGHASTLAGDRLIVDVSTDGVELLANGKPKYVKTFLKSLAKKVGFSIDGEDRSLTTVLTPDKRIMGIEDRAAELLGLEAGAASKLFQGHHGLEELRALVAEFRETGTIINPDW